MKLNIIIFFIIIFTASGDFAISGELAYPPDMKKIIDRGKLIVALYSVDTPPLFMADKNGDLVGYDIDIAKAIAKKLGVGIEFNRNPKTYDGVIEAISRNEADIAVSMITRTLKRAKYVRFSDPYLILKPVLLVNRFDVPEGRSNEEILREMKMKQIIIGEQTKTSYIEIAKDVFPKAVVKEYPLWADAVDQLLKRNVNAFMRDEIGIWNLNLESPEIFLHLKMIELDYPKDQISMVLPYESTHFLAWINIFISDFYPPVPADELVKRYSYLYEKK